MSVTAAPTTVARYIPCRKAAVADEAHRRSIPIRIMYCFMLPRRFKTKVASRNLICLSSLSDRWSTVGVGDKGVVRRGGGKTGNVIGGKETQFLM